MVSLVMAGLDPQLSGSCMAPVKCEFS